MVEPKLHTVQAEVFVAPLSTSRLLLPIFIALLTGAAIPVFWVQVPPLADYINHLARMFVLSNLDHDPLLAKFYGVDWQVIPNLIMDLLVPVLSRYINIYLAGQTFVFLILALLVTGSFAVHYAVFRRWSAWPLVSFLFLYNNIMLFGFMNYLFGLGVALWGLAAWILLRPRSALLRAAVSTAFVLVLFTCHLFAVGLYGMGLLCYEGWMLRDEFERTGLLRPTRALIRDGLAFILSFVPVLPLMWVSPTIGLATENYWDSTGKLDGIYYIFQNYSDLFDLTLASLVIGGTVWAARARMVGLHPVGRYLAILGLVVYMLMPRMFFSSWVADQRLPIALVFLLIGFVSFKDDHRWARYFLYVFVLGIACARFAAVFLVWHQIDGAYADFRHSVGAIEPGSTILVANTDEPNGSDAFNTPLSHAACIAMIERSSLVSTAFTVPGKQILSVKPKYSSRTDTRDGDPPTISQLIAAANRDRSTVPDTEHYWDHWTEQFDYVYVLYTDGGANPAPDLLKLIYSGRQFQLYRVIASSEEE
ncbi:MAG: hypothetical protein WCF85_00290 [Rhodospirillaceae bacterium]